MKFKTIVVAALVGLLAVAGCKKDESKSAPATGSGSAMMGSGSADTMAGSDKMAGSGGAMAGSGGAMAGSDSMAGSGGSMAGSGMTPPPDTGTGAGASMTDAEIEGMIKEMLSMFTDISKGATAGKDCAASAAAIDKVLDDCKAFLDKMKSLSKDTALEDRAKKIMEDKGYTKQLDEASKGLGPVMQKCGSDPAMGKTMQRLGESLQ